MKDLPLEGLEDNPTSARLINDDKKQANKKQYIKHRLKTK
jgi:hypothetical protein